MITTKRKQRTRKDAYSFVGKHQDKIDRQNHSPLEFRYRELYGKWPTTSELAQVAPYLKRRKTIDEDEE